jgi:hypothetical protein
MLDQNGKIFDTSASGFTFGQSQFVSWSQNGNTKAFQHRFGGFYPSYGSAISKNAVIFSGYSNSIVSGSVLVSVNKNKGSMVVTGGWGASPGSFYTTPSVSSRSDNSILAFDGIRLQYFTESLRWLSWDRQPIMWPSRIDSYGDANLIVHNQYYGVLQRFDGKGNLLNEVNIPSCLDFKQDKSGAVFALVDNYTIHEYSKDLVLARVRTRSNTVPAYRLFRDSVGAVHVSCLFNPTTAPTMRIVPVELFSELTPSGYELYTNGIDIQLLKNGQQAYTDQSTFYVWNPISRSNVYAYIPGGYYTQITKSYVDNEMKIHLFGRFDTDVVDGTYKSYPYLVFDPITGDEQYLGEVGIGPGKFPTSPTSVVVNNGLTFALIGNYISVWGPDGDFLLPSTTFSLSPEPTTDGWNRSAVKATLAGKDNAGGSGFKELRYTLDTNAQQTSTNANTNVYITGDGTHTLVFQSVDQAGNVEAAQTKTIKIDSVVPQSSASVNVARDLVTITATDDRAGVKTIYYAVDGGAEQVYGGPFAITVGPHTITYRAVDKAGNVEASRNLVTGIVLSSLELSQSSVLGGGNVTATVKLTAPAPTGGAVVNITSANAAATVPQTVNIAAGQSSATFTVGTTAVATDTDVKLEAIGNDTKAAATLKVLAPAPATLTLAPSSVRGGANSTGTVTLNGPAPTGGLTVSLSSNKSDATVPQSVTVAAGETSKTFTVTTSPVVNETAASITATTAGGTKSATLTLTRAQVSNLSVSPSTITSGATATGTVSIDAPAPAGGTSVSLAVDKSAASVTSTVVIPAGQTTATFTVFTSSVSADTTVFISANANNSSRSNSFTVQPARQVPTSVTLNPTSVLGGAAAQGTVLIGAPAPAGGLSVALTSNNAAATVPGTVLVPAGQTSATFNVATAAVTAPATATITASAGGVSVSSNLTVRVLAPTTLVFSPATLTGGASSTATVTVSDPAPTAGTTVLLSSNNVAAKVPVSVKIAAGQTSATFVVTSVAVAADVNASITATVGTQALSNTLVVKAAVAQSVTFLPSSVLGGKASVGTVTLNGITAVGGRVVQLRSSNPAIAAVPASVTVPVGKNVITFNVTTSAVLTSSNVTITATTGVVEASGTLNVRPVVVKTVVLNPLTVVGPASSIGTITLTEAAPVGGVVVTLSSNNANAVVPASISIAAGKTSGTFTTTTKATGTPQVATITAGLNGAASTGTLTVTPVLVSTLTVAPTSVTGGTNATGTVKLVSAPTVDTVVTLTSANTAIVTVPATVTVLKGTTTATFTVTTKKPAAQTAVTLSAVTGGAAKTVSVTVKP